MTAATATADIVPECPEHSDVIESLLDLAFGPGRYAKTAYRLREGTSPVPGLSFITRIGGTAIGSVRFSPISVGNAPALLLGPLVIHPAHKNRGHGLALMHAGLAAAREQGHRVVILVGDEPYYARAGFARLPRGRIVLPGPVDPARLLGLALVPGALDDLAGAARPAPAG